MPEISESVSPGDPNRPRRTSDSTVGSARVMGCVVFGFRLASRMEF